MKQHRYGESGWGRWGSVQDKLDALGRRTVIRIGVDLGQSMDFTAIAVTEQTESEGKPAFLCRAIERLPLGTPYTHVADRVAFIMSDLRNRSDAEEAGGKPGYRLECVVDRSGVGAAVMDLLRERGVRPLVEVVIVGGDTVTERDGNRISMGKVHLVTRMKILQEQRRLKLPPTEEARLFADELKDYRVDITQAGNQTFSARSGKHDDIIIAVALSTGTGLKSHAVPFVLAMRAVKSRW